MEERKVLSVLEQEVRRIAVRYLMKPGELDRLVGELDRLVAAALWVPPSSVEKLETELSRYEREGDQSALMEAFSEFLESLPPDSEQLFTEQRDSTGTLMSQLRSLVEGERRHKQVAGRSR